MLLLQTLVNEYIFSILLEYEFYNYKYNMIIICNIWIDNYVTINPNLYYEYFVYRMFSELDNNSIKNDILIKKAVIDDLSTTENPLWIEQ